MSETGQPTPEEQGKDFVGDSMEVKLRNGLTVSVTTPTLRWWFDCFLQTAKRMQWASVPQEFIDKFVLEIKKGKLSNETIMQMPITIPELALEIISYCTQKDIDWCKDNMTAGDFAEAVHAWVAVSEPQRISHFFGLILQKLPLIGLFLGIGRTRKGV